MASKLSVLLVLVVATVTVLAQRRRQKAKATDEWNYRDGGELLFSLCLLTGGVKGQVQGSS